MEQAQRIFYRMTEVEKIQVRAATPGRLEYLADTNFRSDMPLLPFDDRTAVMVEVRALCDLERVECEQSTGFPRGWAF